MRETFMAETHTRPRPLSVCVHVVCAFGLCVGCVLLMCVFDVCVRCVCSVCAFGGADFGGCVIEGSINKAECELLTARPSHTPTLHIDVWLFIRSVHVH